MTQTNNSTSQVQLSSLRKRMLAGAGIGLLVIAYFLLALRGADPAWGKLWMIRPLIVVPFAGAVGGLCNYFLMHFHKHFGLNRVIAVVVSVIIFIIGLWMGIVLGLNGTMWN
jgi:hypothetical protein